MILESIYKAIGETKLRLWNVRETSAKGDIQVKVSRNIITAILILFLSSMACNLPSNQQGTPNAYTAAALTVTALAGTAQISSPSPTVTVTPIPSSTVTTFAPLPSTSAVASSTPGGTFFVTDVGANCRNGPGTNYDKIASFAQGSYILLVGRNTDRSWWVLKSGNINCWISATTGHTTGSLDNISEVQAPPTPTAAVSATAYP